jgi:hypothetical protein
MTELCTICKKIAVDKEDNHFNGHKVCPSCFYADRPLNDEELCNLWEVFQDIPYYEDEDDSYLCIDMDFYLWKKGTTQNEISHWFDDHHSVGLINIIDTITNKRKLKNNSL